MHFQLRKLDIPDSFMLNALLLYRKREVCNSSLFSQRQILITGRHQAILTYFKTACHSLEQRFLGAYYNTFSFLPKMILVRLGWVYYIFYHIDNNQS